MQSLLIVVHTASRCPRVCNPRIKRYKNCLTMNSYGGDEFVYKLSAQEFDAQRIVCRPSKVEAVGRIASDRLEQISHLRAPN
jgi:hypothetical protein